MDCGLNFKTPTAQARRYASGAVVPFPSLFKLAPEGIMNTVKPCGGQGQEPTAIRTSGSTPKLRRYNRWYRTIKYRRRALDAEKISRGVEGRRLSHLGASSNSTKIIEMAELKKRHSMLENHDHSHSSLLLKGQSHLSGEAQRKKVSGI